MENGKALAVLFIIILTLILVVFGPFFTIWSLNTIFGLEIAYTFKTWVAVIWLITIIHGIKISVTSR